MKKFFTLVTFILGAMSMNAKEYEGNLKVIVEGVSTYQTAKISVDKQNDGKYTLSLKNFTLGEGTGAMHVGTIVIKDVEATTIGDITKIITNKKIALQDGDDKSIQWMANFINTAAGATTENPEAVPVDLIGRMKGDETFATVINIDLQKSMGMNISVDFSTFMSQLKNSDFESFHEETMTMGENSVSGDEPDYWHSFMCASGGVYAYLAAASGDPHTHESDDVRPGSTGETSLLLTAVDVQPFGIANGTVTTGRLNAGNTKPADLSNHSYIDMSLTDVDGINQPFYPALDTKPDAINVWVKFKQGTPDAKHPYATINGVITDGTYYQDPEDKTYNNVVAKATDTKIASENEWKELNIPFDYESYKANNVEGKTILLTISTNADPGCGSGTDELYIDDLSLVYNAGIKSVKVKGAELTDEDGDHIYKTTVNGAISANDVVVESDGVGAYITKTFTEENGGVTVDVTITSNDLKTENTYKIYIDGATSGINNMPITTTNGIQAIYNLAGQQVSSMTSGNVYIVKTTDGKTKKVIKK